MNTERDYLAEKLCALAAQRRVARPPRACTRAQYEARIRHYQAGRKQDKQAALRLKKDRARWDAARTLLDLHITELTRNITHCQREIAQLRQENARLNKFVTCDSCKIAATRVTPVRKLKQYQTKTVQAQELLVQPMWMRDAIRTGMHR